MALCDDRRLNRVSLLRSGVLSQMGYVLVGGAGMNWFGLEENRTGECEGDEGYMKICLLLRNVLLVLHR